MAIAGSKVDRLWYFTRNSAYVLFTKKDEAVEDQKLLRNSDRPIKQIQDFWASDYLVTQVTYASNTWIVVGEQRKNEVAEQHCSMENSWSLSKKVIEETIAEGRKIQFLNHANNNWIVLAEKNPPSGDKPAQRLHTFPTFPHDFLVNEIWSRNRRVEQCTFGDGIWVVIETDIPSNTPIQQGFIYKSEFPQQTIMDCVRDRKRIKCIAWDDKEKVFGAVWEQEPGKGSYSVVMSNQYPQQTLADLGVV